MPDLDAVALERLAKRLFKAAVLLFITAAVGCFAGVEYAVSRIPADVRAEMTDTDWIGSEWIFRAMAMQFVSMLLAVMAGLAALRARGMQGG